MNGEVITLDKELFGAFIAENRKRQGLTQQQLAGRLHITDKAVSKWERGLSYPDVTLLQPLADVFRLKVDDLLTCRISLAWAAYRMYDIKIAGQMLMDWPAIDNIFVYFLYQFGPVLVVLAGILMAVTLYRLARHGRWQAAACLLVVLFYGYMETQVIHITSNPALLLLVPAVFGDSLSD